MLFELLLQNVIHQASQDPKLTSDCFPDNNKPQDPDQKMKVAPLISWSLNMGHLFLESLRYFTCFIFIYFIYLLCFKFNSPSPPHPDPTFLALVNLVEVLQQYLTQYTQLLQPPGVSEQHVALLFAVLVHHHYSILLNEVWNNDREDSMLSCSQWNWNENNLKLSGNLTEKGSLCTPTLQRRFLLLLFASDAQESKKENQWNVIPYFKSRIFLLVSSSVDNFALFDNP